MMDCVFKPGQTYRTRDGREALIYCNDAPGDFPVHGRVGKEVVRWHADGSFFLEPGDVDDLLPPAPPIIREMRWCNVYSHGCTVDFASLEGARDAADDSRTTPQRTAVPCLLAEIVDGEPGE